MHEDAQVFLEDAIVGQPLPELVKKPTVSMLFRFSAVTWNAHRIHYDRDYARSENHPDILVQATMHGGFLLQMLASFAGPRGRIVSFKYANRERSFPGDILTCGGTIVSKDERKIDCEIWERNQRDQICANGSAAIVLPRKPA